MYNRNLKSRNGLAIQTTIKIFMQLQLPHKDID